MTLEHTQLKGLGTEPGFDTDEVEPARVSGFFALFFAIASAISFLGIPLLLLPCLAIVLGFMALRRWEGSPPLGTGAAKLGLILAVGFGSFAALVPYLKTRTLGNQAKQFSLQYLNLVSQGDDMVARELRKSYLNRMPASMSLREYYDTNEEAQQALELFHLLPLNTVIRRYAPGAAWQLDRPPQVDHHFGREQVEVVWRGPTGGERIQFFMEFQRDPEGVGHWHVETVQRHRERIVAEKVL